LINFSLTISVSGIGLALLKESKNAKNKKSMKYLLPGVHADTVLRGLPVLVDGVVDAMEGAR
jgi:hypothetical protein